MLPHIPGKIIPTRRIEHTFPQNAKVESPTTSHNLESVIVYVGRSGLRSIASAAYAGGAGAPQVS